MCNLIALYELTIDIDIDNLPVFLELLRVFSGVTGQ